MNWVRVLVLVVVSSSPFSITIRFPVVEPLTFPCNACRAPKKQPTMLGEMDVHHRLSFLTGGTIRSGQISWCRAVPAWVGGNTVHMGHSSHLTQSVLVSCGSGGFFSLIPMF